MWILYIFLPFSHFVLFFGCFCFCWSLSWCVILSRFGRRTSFLTFVFYSIYLFPVFGFCLHFTVCTTARDVIFPIHHVFYCCYNNKSTWCMGSYSTAVEHRSTINRLSAAYLLFVDYIIGLVIVLWVVYVSIQRQLRFFSKSSGCWIMSELKLQALQSNTSVKVYEIQYNHARSIPVYV